MLSEMMELKYIWKRAEQGGSHQSEPGAWGTGVATAWKPRGCRAGSLRVQASQPLPLPGTPSLSPGFEAHLCFRGFCTHTKRKLCKCGHLCVHT